MGLALSRVAVNLFPNQAHDDTLPKDVEDALAASGLPADALELEITEYAAFNYEDPTGPLLKLQEKGVRLAFDDFGTGYASLNYLTRFPVSRIKIDRSFVGKITDNAEDAAIVRSLIAMAHNLELEVIAEGVETHAQAAFLLNERCQEAQGFLYSKPLPAEDFEAYLRTRRLALDVDKVEKRVNRNRNVQRRSAAASPRRDSRGRRASSGEVAVRFPVLRQCDGSAVARAAAARVDCRMKHRTARADPSATHAPLAHCAGLMPAPAPSRKMTVPSQRSCTA